MASNLRALGPVSQSPSVSDEAIAEYLRADLGDTFEISRLRAAAEQIVSDMTGRAVLNRSFVLSLAAWPVRSCLGFKSAAKLIELPRSPLVSVTSVKYYDLDGDQQTFSADKYLVIAGYEPGSIYLKDEYEFPEIYDRPDAIQIEFIAGTGTETSNTDATLAQAILLICRHFFSGGSPNLGETKDGLAAERILLGRRVSGFIR
jgi:uncharacterized phiE125 gp8 family phage protein